VVVLDDGFQHGSLWRDLDVVLLDASNPFGPGALLPRGILREPVNALRRADAIVLTRVDMAAARLPALRQQVGDYSKGRPVYGVRMTAEALWQQDSAVADGLARLQGSRVVAFAGIGNPQAFVAMLEQLGSAVAALVVFPDHYRYTVSDWQSIGQIARQQRATCLVTTEKDAVRLPISWQTGIPVYTLRIGVRIMDGVAALEQQLAAVMAYA
jgi:tetraacyldisaccharide 4'-kinase